MSENRITRQKVKASIGQIAYHEMQLDSLIQGFSETTEKGQDGDEKSLKALIKISEEYGFVIYKKQIIELHSKDKTC